MIVFPDILALDMLKFLSGSTIVSFDAAASSVAVVLGAGDCAHIATADGALLLICVKPDELATLAWDV